MVTATTKPDQRPLAPFDQMVFSGGGLRCFWHGGWLEAVSREMRFDPARVTGSSGGALSAAAFIARREEFLFDRFVRAVASCRSNASADDLLDGEDGRSPHQRIYQAIVDDVIDEDAQSMIADGPAFQICVSTPGDSVAPTLRALIGGTVYQVEQAVASTPRPRFADLTGMKRRLIDAREAARQRCLPDLIRMAATVPPVFRADVWDHDPVYDGGMVDKAPLPEPDEGRTLVLLTKRFDSLPEDATSGRIVYVQPSSDVLSGSKLDFSNPDLLQEAWEQGRRDGLAWLETTN